ncbi:MAG: 23S rRNA (guanosine(2251)-2'-O)-methyltransferase RlmB [Candidatus Eremiobacteraeota bacterium]|nr:23S rRNA (guanosine(2251)-2'-O)-methyltransferase RlmB [Candidatus Eremiobacteraeota bacterium]MBV8367044.1 23S rRNA (guanosine(2251)-2'-O)-methyltransferase RlmB [Candidatus Eremiobacteraeota bacterium]
MIEALTGGEDVKAVIVGERRRDDRALKELIDRARKRGVPVQTQPEAWFRRFGDVRHQRVAARVAPFEHADWAEMKKRLATKADALVVVADHIEDPQNLGAIMRAAEAAGADALVVPDRRSAGVTAATRRAAAGAASHLPVIRVPNIVRTIEELKQDGHWVNGLTAAPAARAYTEVDFRGNCTLVVGSEGSGLGRLVAERCDTLIAIPMLGKVASLNAATAVAVVLYEAVRQRRQPLVKTGTSRPVNP